RWRVAGRGSRVAGRGTRSRPARDTQNAQRITHHSRRSPRIRTPARSDRSRCPAPSTPTAGLPPVLPNPAPTRHLQCPAAGRRGSNVVAGGPVSSHPVVHVEYPAWVDDVVEWERPYRSDEERMRLAIAI